MTDIVKRLRATCDSDGCYPDDPCDRCLQEWEAADEIESLRQRLDAAEARLRRYEPEPDICEHGVTEGDWCEPCNQAYKEAANGGGHE